ncbi:MAG: HigA family addiction module antitoxin [Rhizomicrobium sp.]
MTSTSKITTEPMGHMKNPSHPGDLVLLGILEPLGISITRAAEMLGVRRATLSDVVNGKASMSAEMAFRLHKVFGISAELMLRVQNQYDLARVRENAKQIRVKRFHRKAA